jgi:hypothetical protein
MPLKLNYATWQFSKKQFSAVVQSMVHLLVCLIQRLIFYQLFFIYLCYMSDFWTGQEIYDLNKSFKSYGNNLSFLEPWISYYWKEITVLHNCSRTGAVQIAWKKQHVFYWFCYVVFYKHMFNATEVQQWKWCFHIKFVLFMRPIHVWRSRTPVGDWCAHFHSVITTKMEQKVQF